VPETFRFQATPSFQNPPLRYPRLRVAEALFAGFVGIRDPGALSSSCSTAVLVQCRQLRRKLHHRDYQRIEGSRSDRVALNHPARDTGYYDKQDEFDALTVNSTPR
jgi:hypothetical protein